MTSVLWYIESMIQVQHCNIKKQKGLGSSKTTVVRLKRQGGKVIQDCDVYIGRRCNMGGWKLKESKWANPYTVKEYGREGALIRYRKHLYESGLIDDIEELRGKILGCFCKPDPCHGDILVELLEKR